MMEFKAAVTIAGGVMTILGLFAFFESRTTKRHDKDAELKMMQVEATHQNTLQMRDLTHQMKLMGNTQDNHGRRINDLEDYVYKGDRPHFTKDHV